MRTAKRILAPILFIVILATLGFAQRDIYQRRIKITAADRIFLLPRKKMMKILSFGHEKTMADLLWIRAVQFFGGNFSTLKGRGMDYKGEGLKKLLYVIQYLDPKIYSLYDFGGFVFTEGLNEPYEAIEFLRLGDKQFEEDWKLMFDAAFTAFYYAEDMEKAVEIADEVSSRPYAPDHVKRLKAIALSEMGQYDLAIEHFMKIIEESESDIQKEIARNRLHDIIRERNIHVLQNLIDQYEEKFGKPVETLQDLVEAGLIRSLPEDPRGDLYYYVPRLDKVVMYQEALKKQEQLVEAIQQEVNKYYEEHGEYPQTVDEILPEEVNRENVYDPLGGEFKIDPETGNVSIIPGELKTN